MIKYTVKTTDGKMIVGLGLDAENVKRLCAKMPILVQLKALGLADIDILIHYGETIDAMYQDLAEMIGPDTIVHGEHPYERHTNTDNTGGTS